MWVSPRHVALLSLLTLGTVAGAAAETPSGFYLGAKAGNVGVDVEEIDDTSAPAIQAGWQFPIGLAVQVEALAASSDFESFAQTGDADITSFGVYGVYRTPGTIYFMAKGGALLREQDIEVTGVSSSDSDASVSAGLGGGVRLGDHVFLEAEYTLLEEDLSFLGVGVNVLF